jgi:hypothetical protein
MALHSSGCTKMHPQTISQNEKKKKQKGEKNP